MESLLVKRHYKHLIKHSYRLNESQPSWLHILILVGIIRLSANYPDQRKLNLAILLKLKKDVFFKLLWTVLSKI